MAAAACMYGCSNKEMKRHQQKLEVRNVTHYLANHFTLTFILYLHTTDKQITPI